MCSLYSINNSSKFAGQSSFQVVLCAKGSDNNQNYNSTSSSGSAWSASCSHSKRKKMKGAVACEKGPVLVISSSHKDLSQSSVFNPPSFQAQDNNRVSTSPHYPPLSRTPSTQSYQYSQQRRRGHSSHGTSHWQQFHQHNHSFDASFEHDLGEHHKPTRSHSVSHQKHASWSSESQYSANHRDAGNRRSSPILNPTNSVQFHSKTSSSQSSPTLSSQYNPSSLSLPRSMACAPVATATFTSRPADTTVTTFAAAVAAAATTSSPPISSPRSSLSSIFRSKQDSSATETLASSINNEAIAIMSVMDAQPELHSKNMIKYSSVISSNSSEEVDDLSSPMGTSVDSNTNEVFDADEMELQHSNDPDSHMAEAETVTYPLAVHTVRVPNMDSDLKLERKSHLRRKVDRLRAKNAALKSTVTQVKCDLSLERQKRLTMDQIYQNIKKDLNKRLDSEEIKVLNLKAELEQMAAELKKVKSQLAIAKAGASAGGKGSSLGYKIGYDSRSFSLSSGISNMGGLMLHHHANLNLIGGQDDSEEFLHSHSYSPVTVQTSPLMSTCSDSITMSCSDSENEDMDDEEQSEEDEGTLLFTQTPNLLTSSSPRRASNSLSSSLPILVEEESEEEESEDDDSDDEQGDAPRTMMEIIMCQQARSPEDDMEDPPADANETFETMAQKALYHATLLKFTPGQAHLQLEELALKYNARLEQVVDVIVKELTRWWEDERIATGGPTSGGWGTENVVINKETGELANPKTVIEKRVETFFGPLLLQLVASLSEQKMLLEKLENFAKSDARWLKNHNSILVALCKSEVVETKAVLEWWRALEQPQGVFGHGGNDLRSLNSRFVAWLEDEEDDSESEDDDEEDENDYDFDSCSDSDDSDDDSDEDDSDDDDDMEQDEDNEVEAILDMAYPSTTISREDNGMAKKTEEQGSKTSTVDSIEGDAGVSAEPKRRISFCTNNLYYSNDGRICSKKDSSVGEDGEKEHANKKKYQQCPPYRAPESEAEASDTEIMADEDRTD